MAKVTLTFDNGPEPDATPDVLACLARHDVRATFFVVGSKVIRPEGRAIAMRAREEGHWIGNHTFSHTRPLGELDRESALAEFERTEQALAWLDQPMRLFRPYARGGYLGPQLLHPAVVERLQAGRYHCVLWNSVPGDWHDQNGWMVRAIADCRSREWSVVVLHDLAIGAMPHLERFIHTLTDEGFDLQQGYPDECVPIADGRMVLPLEPYLTTSR